MSDIGEIKNNFSSIKNQLIEIKQDKTTVDSCNTIVPVKNIDELLEFFPFLEFYIDDFLETKQNTSLDCIQVPINNKEYYLDFFLKYNKTEQRSFIYFEDNTLKYNAKRIIQQQRNEYFIYSEHLSTIQKEKDLFFQKINHEIRNPLQNAMIIVDNILDENTADNRSNLKYVNHNLNNVVKITKDILDLGKISQATLNLYPAKNNISKLLKSIKEKNQFTLDLNNNHLKIENPIEENALNVLIDDVRFQQIFDNLIGNANKFTESGEIKIGIKKLKETTKNLKVYFFVQDSGVGMNQEQANVIFDDFVQIHNNKKHSGAGLGLSIVKQLVGLHKGKIKALSKKSVGTSIEFDLTFEKQKENNIEGFKEIKKSIKNKRILLIDDDPLTLLVTKAALQKIPTEVSVCKNKEEAIDLYSNYSFDIILSDFNITSTYTAFNLKEDLSKINANKQSKWFLLSGDKIENYKKHGFLDAIVKPQPIKAIVDCIEQQL